MDRWKNTLRVKLTADLSAYHPALAEGAEGIVVEFFGPGANGKKYWQVDFPVAGISNIPLDKLEALDEEYRREIADRQNTQLQRMLKEAKEAVVYVSPKGEFRTLHVWYKKEHDVIDDYERAKRIVKLLKERGAPVSRDVWH